VYHAAFFDSVVALAAVRSLATRELSEQGDFDVRALQTAAVAV